MLEALKHRNDYPLVEVKENGVTKESREITVRGTNAEAIELLDAQHRGARMLIYDTLICRRKTSKAGMIAVIEKNMFCLEPPANAKGEVFLRQERLIALLADMERQDGGNDIERLTEKYVAFLERNAADTPGEKKRHPLVPVSGERAVKVAMKRSDGCFGSRTKNSPENTASGYWRCARKRSVLGRMLYKVPWRKDRRGGRNKSS